MNRAFSSADKNLEKIEFFSKTVKRNVDNLISEIDEEMKDYRKDFFGSETKKLDNEINDYYNKNISNIDSETKVRLSKIKIDKKHEYLQIRDDLQNNLFGDLEQKLLEFIKSPAYDEFLLRSCERCVNVFQNKTILINISENDKDKIPLIENHLGDKLNHKIEFTDNIKFGGLYFYDTTDNVVLNETIDERLQWEKLHFNQ